jgi:hypothetical protein
MLRISRIDKLACADSASSWSARVIEDRQDYSPVLEIAEGHLDRKQRSKPGSFVKTT